MRVLSRLFACLVLGVGLSACSSGGPQPIKVKGKLTYNGQPLKTSVTMTFIPVVEPDVKYNTYLATVNSQDGTYVVNGRENDGIPAGKYRIAIIQMASTPTDEMHALNEQFSKDNTPLVRDVVDEKTPVNIDLAKP